MYAGASGDYNPLHSDEKFAREVAGYPGIFAHGMLTMGMTGRVVTDWFDVGRVTKYGVRFVRQVWPGDTLTATAVVDAIREEDGEQFADVSITTVDAGGHDRPHRHRHRPPRPVDPYRIHCRRWTRPASSSRQ